VIRVPPAPFVRRVVPAALLALSVVGCGKRGDPLPPLRRVPQPVIGLNLAQRGDKLEIAYTVPRNTTDGGRLPVLEVDVLRMDGEGEFPKEARHRRRKAAPGETLVDREPLPAPGTPVRVAVRAIANGKTSVSTLPASLTVKTPPPPPSKLVATLTAEGVALAWEGELPAPPPVAAAPAPTPAAPTLPTPAAPAPTTPSTPPGAAPTPTPTPPFRPGFWVYRRNPESDFGRPLFPSPTEARTYVDTVARAGERWCYVARTVVSADPVIESGSSDEACIDVKDIAPPAAPVGLTAVARDAVVELRWSPSTEPDLRLYRVYRSPLPGAPAPLADVPAGETTYLDGSGEEGRPYRYTVTAVDAAGNESPASNPADARRP
jgi:hypothetical protein